MLSTVMNRLNDRRDASLEGQEADAGFTLIELMVVLLILAILLAIAIPTFLGVTNSANDRAAQANLNTTYTDAKSIYESNSQSYPAAPGTTLASSIAANEPSLGILTTQNSAGTVTVTPGGVSIIASQDGNGALMMSPSKKTNECWYIVDNTSAVTSDAVGIGVVLWSTTAPAPGIPTTAGVTYGVYKYSNATPCTPAALYGVTALNLNTSANSFPNAK